MTFRTYLIFCFLFIGLFIERNDCLAQEIKLKDITKIDLVASAPWWNSTYFRRSEIVFENNKWNCYQKWLVKDSTDQKELKLNKKINIINVRYSTRRFLRTISEKELNQMLTYINKPDTVLKFDQFNVSPEQLKQWVDTLQVHAKESLSSFHQKEDSVRANLTSEQKAYFYKVIESKEIVENAGLAVINPLALQSDRTYYGISFTFKDKHTDTISAYVNSYHPYHLPWRIKNKQSYNPHLSELFEYFIGNQDFITKEKNSFTERIDRELFRRAVISQIFWDYYKNHHPANYKTLSKTLSPASSYMWGAGHFKSSLLPANIQLRFGYGLGDTLKTEYYNALEKVTAANHKVGNYIFDYLKDHPNIIARIDGIGFKIIEQIKATYPEIAKYDVHKIEALNLSVNFYRGWEINQGSGWIILPDGKFILIYCGDSIIKYGDKFFPGLEWDKNKYHNYCIVFDKQGHKIAGGESPVKIGSD